MWTRVAKEGDITEGNPLVADVGGVQVAVFKLGPSYHAIENGCAHRGGPLAEGHVENGEVTCPWHAWSFDVKTGACTSDPGMRQKMYAVKVEGGHIYVESEK
jgi:nitrite reductase/ring-hydroxylating ferredoxin subunit